MYKRADDKMNELKSLMDFENDGKWLQANLENIRKKHGDNKFIAVKDKQVIADDKDFKKIVKEIKNKGVKPSEVLIQFIHDKDYVMIF